MCRSGALVGKVDCKLLKEVRTQKRLSAEELREITEIARDELHFLVRNNIPLIPENYVLWFEIFCYIKENNLKLSDLEIMGLFKEKYPTASEVEKVLIEVEPEEKETLKKIASEITDEIKSLISNLQRHNERIEEKETSIKEIRENLEDKSIKDLVAQILSELREIKEQNYFLKKKLEEANGRIKKLTEELKETKKEAAIDFLTQVANRASFDRMKIYNFIISFFPIALFLLRDLFDFHNC
jgi:diguanylate cyclase